MKTLITLLLSIAAFSPAGAGTFGNEPDSAKHACQLVTPADEATIEFDLESGILFQEKVYIHIEDSFGNQLINAAFSREEISSNGTLNQLLRKSTRYLTLDNHYYYYAGE